MAWIRACGGGSPAIPDGRTVTPINDVTIWQKCAGIANPTYTTLAEVLADTGILQILMASDNAVDYLARSKQFIGSLALVPTMTSNTTPSGEAFGIDRKQDESDYSSITLNNDANAYYVFDGNTNTYPLSRAGYDFGHAVTISSVEIVINQSPGVTCTVWASNEKTQNYTKVGQFVTTSAALTAETHNITPATYRYWLVVPVGEGGFREVQFYSPDGICQSSNAMYYIGQNNYASNTLLADSDWMPAICNSTYFESVLNVKNPAMTSTTTPSGVVSAKSYREGRYAWYAFDGSSGTVWQPNSMNTTGDWVQYQFSNAINAYKIVVVVNRWGSMANITYEMNKSDDGNNWTRCDSFVVSGTSTNTIIGNFAGIYFRLVANGTMWTQNSDDSISDIRIYGRADV